MSEKRTAIGKVSEELRVFHQQVAVKTQPSCHTCQLQHLYESLKVGKSEHEARNRLFQHIVELPNSLNMFEQGHLRTNFVVRKFCRSKLV